MFIQRDMYKKIEDCAISHHITCKLPTCKLAKKLAKCVYIYQTEHIALWYVISSMKFAWFALLIGEISKLSFFQNLGVAIETSLLWSSKYDIGPAIIFFHDD